MMLLSVGLVPVCFGQNRCRAQEKTLKIYVYACLSHPGSIHLTLYAAPYNLLHLPTREAIVASTYDAQTD